MRTTQFFRYYDLFITIYTYIILVDPRESVGDHPKRISMCTYRSTDGDACHFSKTDLDHNKWIKKKTKSFFRGIPLLLKKAVLKVDYFQKTRVIIISIVETWGWHATR